MICILYAEWKKIGNPKNRYAKFNLHITYKSRDDAKDSITIAGVEYSASSDVPPPLRCTRCQGIGHGKFRCTKPFRCCHCAGPHPTMTCPNWAAIVQGAAARKCANCKGPHGASSRSCPTFKSAFDQKRKANKPQPSGDATQPAAEGSAQSRVTPPPKRQAAGQKTYAETVRLNIPHTNKWQGSLRHTMHSLRTVAQENPSMGAHLTEVARQLAGDAGVDYILSSPVAPTVPSPMEVQHAPESQGTAADRQEARQEPNRGNTNAQQNRPRPNRGNHNHHGHNRNNRRGARGPNRRNRRGGPRRPNFNGPPGYQPPPQNFHTNFQTRESPPVWHNPHWNNQNYRPPFFMDHQRHFGGPEACNYGYQGPEGHNAPPRPLLSMQGLRWNGPHPMYRGPAFHPHGAYGAYVLPFDRY